MNAKEQQETRNLSIVATITKSQKKRANVHDKLPVESTQTKQSQSIQIYSAKHNRPHGKGENFKLQQQWTSTN